MDHIDVHDLPEEDTRFVAAFVALLRHCKQEQAKRTVVPQEASPEIPRFAVWPLGVKGTLSRKEL